MAKYKDSTTGEVIEVGSAALNPTLVAGKTLVPDTTPLGIPTITASSLSSTETPLNLPPVETNTNANASVASIIPTQDELQRQINAQYSTSATETEGDDIARLINESAQKLSGKSQAQAAAEQAAGLPEYQKQLTEVSGQIQALQKEAAAIPLQLQESVTGKGVTAGGLAPIQAGELRKNAIRQLGLASIAQTLQGNVALAQQTADRAIQREYGDEEAKLEYQKTLYGLNKDKLERIDKKKADALAIALQDRERQLADEKENTKIIMGWAAEASKLGNVDALTRNRALATKDPRQALAILGPYLSDPNAKAQALADLEYKRMQTKLAEVNIGKVKADTAKEYAEAAKIAAEAKALGQVDSNGRVVVDKKDSIKLNQDLVKSDSYKAIVKGQDSLQFLTAFEDKFKETGATSAVFSPRQNADLQAKYNAAILNLKEFFNLGVLNGPDEKILRSVLPDPTNRSAFLTGITGGIYLPSKSTEAGIANMKAMIEKSLDARYDSLTQQYGQYSSDSVTSLNDLNQKYIQQKATINPDIKKMIEENPGLTVEDIISIIKK